MNIEPSPLPIGIDLLQDRFHIFMDEENQSNRVISKLLPTALLPLYSGEKGIYGLESLNHRRAKGWLRPNECRMFWDNDSEKGCGRVTLAAAMQRLVNYHVSWGEDKNTSTDNFVWHPLRSKQFLSAAEIITGSLQSLMQNIRSYIALPLPDSSSQSVQQDLINTFYSRGNTVNNCGSTLLLLKRSIAQAMLWCKENQDQIARVCEPIDKKHVGHLVVINVAMDFWEARLVPLCWHLSVGQFYLVPVDSAYWPRESLQVSGWQLATNWLAAEGIVDESLWQALVGQELLQDLLNNQHLTPSQWKKIYQIAPNDLPHSADLYSYHLPELTQVEQSLKNLLNRRHELHSENSKSLGFIVDGCFSEWLLKLNLLKVLELDKHLPFTIGNSTCPSFAVQGAQLYAKHQLENSPTYLEELIPICIWCRNSNRYGQEYIWKSLISNNTIPAGRSSKLENCPGFILPAGQNQVQLILRRPSIDRHQEYEYRKITAKIYEKFNSNVNVTISVEIKPGNGHAKARLLKDDGHLLSELNWQAMTKCEKPIEHQPAYLARTCEAICDNQYWHGVAKELKKLNIKSKLKKNNKLYLLEESVELIHDLFKNIRVRAHKNDIYLEYRIISSEGTVTSENETLNLLSQFLETCYLLADFEDENLLKKRVLQAMRHLFTAISKPVRQIFLKKLDIPYEINMQELLCIGQTFSEANEIIKFFETFLTLEHKEIFYWLRALRSILRYRYQAFDPEIINDDLYINLWVNVTNKLSISADRPKILKAALQCLIYMLGRRRFNKSFVGLQSELNAELNEIIKKLRFQNLHINILIQLEKLLNCTATEEEIGQLLGNEVLDD